MRSSNKVYTGDLGLRCSVLASKAADHGQVLENIVSLELIQRGYEVLVGEVGQREIDFIVFGDDGVEYYQVAYTLIDPDGSTGARELASLAPVKDHNPKYLMAMDWGESVSPNGIRQLNGLGHQP